MTIQKQHPKSGSKKPRRKPRKANGKANGVTADPRAIGTTVQVSSEDKKTIAIKRVALADLEQRIGQTRANFIKQERALLEQHAKVEGDYQSLVRTVAEKLELTKPDESWHFDATKTTFTRTR